MSSLPLVTRSWNGQTIRMRGGRICLTDLCRAGATRGGNPIRFAHWFESDPTQRFLNHRSSVTDRPVFAISSVIDNAENSALIIRESERGDAWGDKVVGVRLAAQLCVELEHLVYEWFTEEVERQALPAHETRPALNPRQEELSQALANVETGLRILERLGMCDDRDRLQYKRYANMLVQAAAVAGGALPGTNAGLLSPAEELPRFDGKVVDPEAPLTIVEFATSYLQGNELKAINQEDCRIGRSVHAAYKKRHGEEAPTTTHLSVKAEAGRKRLSLPVFGSARNGNAVSPRVYLPRDWDLLIEEIRQRGVIQADRAATLRAELQQFRHGQPA